MITDPAKIAFHGWVGTRGETSLIGLRCGQPQADAISMGKKPVYGSSLILQVVPEVYLHSVVHVFFNGKSSFKVVFHRMLSSLKLVCSP